MDLTTKDSPYLSQKKLYKGASADYIEKAKEWNKEVKEYNKAIKDNLDKLDENKKIGLKTSQKKRRKKVFFEGRRLFF